MFLVIGMCVVFVNSISESFLLVIQMAAVVEYYGVVLFSTIF